MNDLIKFEANYHTILQYNIYCEAMCFSFLFWLSDMAVTGSYIGNVL